MSGRFTIPAGTANSALATAVAPRECHRIATAGTVAESIRALLAAGARPEMIVAATHGLFLPGAREKLSQPAVREVWVTGTVSVADKGWPGLSVVSVAPLLAAALKRFLADGSIGDLY